MARKSNPRLYIIVRTRYLAEVDNLIQLGANEVIPEEFETSIEIFGRVLHQFQVPRNLIFELIEKIRKGSYEALRKVDLPVKTLPEKCEVITEIDTETYLIKEDSAAAGRSLKDLRIRSKTGATVIAIRRGEKVIPSPEPTYIFQPGDVIYLIGKRENVINAIEWLEH